MYDYLDELEKNYDLDIYDELLITDKYLRNIDNPYFRKTDVESTFFKDSIFTLEEQQEFAEDFMKLCQITVPYGKENLIEHLIPKGSVRDAVGNHFITIGDKPTVLYSCHLDTYSYSVEDVNPVFENGIVKSGGKTVLGADDKAGMLILNKMIEAGIEGLYCYFVGEEVGGIGSSYAVNNTPEIFDGINSAISFDRQRYNSIITTMCGLRVASDDFCEAIVDKLNKYGFDYRLDVTGGFTDVFLMRDLIPNSTNISVGYFNPHMKFEYQDIEYLHRLCQAVAKQS